jgi:preprotein translocase subunit SecY
MKFVSNILENVENIQSFYNIGLIIFIVLFAVILIRTLRMPKKEADEIKNSILD